MAERDVAALRFFKTRTFLIPGVLALLVALYSLAGFLWAPRLIRSALLEDVPKATGARVAVGEIRVNPLRLELGVDDFALSTPAGEKLLGFQRLFLGFEFSSLWHRAYSFSNIDLTAPFVAAVVATDGSLNLAQLKPKAAAAPAPQPQSGKPAALPAIRIRSFKISQGLVTYEDRTQPDVFAARLEPIDFELKDFTTGVLGGRFTFSGSSKQGERIEWGGHVSVQPVASDGEFRIEGLLVHTLWEYLQDRLNFTINSGSIDLAASYRFTAGDGAVPGNLKFDVSKVALANLTLSARGEAADWVTVPELTVTGTQVDLANREAHVDEVALTGFNVTGWLEPDGTFNLQRLAAPPPKTEARAAPPAPPTVSTGAPAPGAPPAAPPAWRFDLREFDVRDAHLSVEDRTVHPAAKLALAPLALKVTGISQDLSKPVTVEFDTRVNTLGSVAVSGTVAPAPMAADLTLKAAGIDLAAVQPYIARRSSMTLMSGALEAAAKLHYAAQKGAPTLEFSGDVGVEKVHTVDDALHADFINWERLDIRRLAFSQNPDRLDIDQIVVRKPYARVIIGSDESLNVKRILTPRGAAAGPAAPKDTAPEPARDASAVRSASSKHAPAGAPEAAAAPPGMPMSIKKIRVQAGQANFSDLSVKPNFSTGIQALDGSITGLSSKPGSRAKMDLHGSIDQYAPVSITGEFNVLGPKLYTDVRMNFSNIELSIFNPYSGKFAGYNISKGKLSTELHYQVDGRALDAQHHIVVDQLEFGDKTASKDAVSLPIKLAVSLLKDRHGVIDLTLPVTGSLDDPKFRLGPLIWQVLVNILEKAITAPFALLGSLFGGGPDLQFIDFQPGASTLGPAAADKARAVAKALLERPQLKIEVPIAVVPDIDRPALVATQFEAELAASQAGKNPKKASAASPPPAFATLDASAQLDLLTKIYTKDLGAAPKFPDSVTAAKSKSDVLAGKIEFLKQAIRDHIQVGDAELLALGQQRAQQLQQVLLTGTQVEAERVFLVANDKATAKDGLVRLELTLQ